MALNQVSVSPSRTARVLGAVWLLLVLVSLGGQVARSVLGDSYRLPPIFNVDREQNVPTYFTVLLMLLAALLLGVIAVLQRKQRAPHVSKWAILSFGFVLMAYDEAFQVHETLNRPIRALMGDGNLGLFFFAWVIPGLAVVVILGLFFVRFLRYLPATTRRAFLMAATLYLGGAIGAELIGGRHVELHGLGNWTYRIIATIEETLEVAGLVVFIRALLKYCADNHDEVRFRFDDFAGTARSTS